MEANQLKLLLDYTTFHIGLYSTLITGLLAFVTFFGTPSKKLFWTMVVTIACFLLAGMFGGSLAVAFPITHLLRNLQKRILALLGFR